MNVTRLTGLDAADPLGFLAALGVLRVTAHTEPAVQLRWERNGRWLPELRTPAPLDPVRLLFADAERWREGHPAIDFAVGADRKEQDLKHPPAEFCKLMLELVRHPEAAEFVAAYATGVAVDGSGQTKPTSLHLTSAKQRFMAAVLDLRDGVTRGDLEEAVYGPWVARVGPKNMRWRAASKRSRALLSFNPGNDKPSTVVGASWLAFQSMPLFPVVPVGRRAVTTGFTGRGKNEQFTWPVWSPWLELSEVRVLLGQREIDQLSPAERRRRGIAQILRSDVVRSDQGYGNFSASRPV